MSTAELIRCVEREIAMRRNVYPKRVTLNMMTQSTADHEIRCMEEIRSLLHAREQAEQLL